jgi:hypothetical protein
LFFGCRVEPQDIARLALQLATEGFEGRESNGLLVSVVVIIGSACLYQGAVDNDAIEKHDHISA